MTKIAAPKGTRDFYPEDMAVRNAITDAWRTVSLRNGFVEYDGPIFELLGLYTAKSGEGIVSELFTLTDRGGRDLAIRPEMTPTLARMVNAKINSLAQPIKWFSIPRCCRAERPQRGRLREFFQWNVDIIGPESVMADAECIFTAIDYLRTAGLSPRDCQVHISCRAMLAAILQAQGFRAETLDALYVLLDKRPKIPAEAFEKMVAEVVDDPALQKKLLHVGDIGSLDDAEKLAHSDAAAAAVDRLRQLFAMLSTMGVGEYCRFDIQIVRGLAYYTGPVFEILSCGATLRALCGGGRYDQLLGSLGGPAVSGTGFGMGDVVLGIVLEEKGLLTPCPTGIDVYVIALDEVLMTQALSIAGALRRAGIATDISYKTSGLGKQLKAAVERQARRCVILGGETLDNGQVTIRNMEDNTQILRALQQVLNDPADVL